MEQNTSLIDLKALSEPAVKLIETVSNAIGLLYEPTKMKRMAKADIVVAKIKLEGQMELTDLQKRILERISAKEERRQQNIESITNQAIQYLPETVSEEKPNEDWVVEFYEKSQDVSNEQMQ